MNEKRIRKFFMAVALLMSATILYGGYQVHQEADKQESYEKALREKAKSVGEILNRQMGGDMALKDPMRFLRTCSEEL